MESEVAERLEQLNLRLEGANRSRLSSSQEPSVGKEEEDNIGGVRD